MKPIELDKDGEVTYTDEVCSLEHSQYSEDEGCFPFHIGPLQDALRCNTQDYHHNNRHENKWQIIYIGSFANCSKACDELYKRRQKEIKARKAARKSVKL